MYILVVLGFWSVFGQSWAREPAQRPRLEKRYINQRKLAQEIASRALQKVWAFRFFDPGPGASGGPRKVPLGYPGPARGPRGPPGGLRDLRQTKAKNLET